MDKIILIKETKTPQPRQPKCELNKFTGKNLIFQKVIINCKKKWSRNYQKCSEKCKIARQLIWLTFYRNTKQLFVMLYLIPGPPHKPWSTLFCNPSLYMAVTFEPMQCDNAI